MLEHVIVGPSLERKPVQVRADLATDVFTT
jgi:hypothetical protein